MWRYRNVNYTRVVLSVLVRQFLRSSIHPSASWLLKIGRKIFHELRARWQPAASPPDYFSAGAMQTCFRCPCWWVHKKLHMHMKSPTQWNMCSPITTVSPVVGMLVSAPLWRSSWTTELCPSMLALNTAVSPSCKEGKWGYIWYTICYHGHIKVSYSSGTLWLTVRRILTLHDVHVEYILYTRPSATMQAPRPLQQ